MLVGIGFGGLGPEAHALAEGPAVRRRPCHRGEDVFGAVAAVEEIVVGTKKCLDSRSARESCASGPRAMRGFGHAMSVERLRESGGPRTGSGTPGVIRRLAIFAWRKTREEAAGWAPAPRGRAEVPEGRGLWPRARTRRDAGASRWTLRMLESARVAQRCARREVREAQAPHRAPVLRIEGGPQALIRAAVLDERLKQIERRVHLLP